jgi:hypothetical protein
MHEPRKASALPAEGQGRRRAAPAADHQDAPSPATMMVAAAYLRRSTDQRLSEEERSVTRQKERAQRLRRTARMDASGRADLRG